MTRESTDFLYPFIEADEHDPEALLTDLAASAEAKMTESAALAAATVTANRVDIDRAAAAMAARFATGGRLYCFGNGGSATDAAGAARLFSRPPAGRPLPARDLAEDPAVLTALANDVGFDLVFARQLAAQARRGDMALAFSTSGNSANLAVAMAESRRRGLLTLAVSGTGGGRLAADGQVEHCLTVTSQSVHRIQEAQREVLVALWQRVQDELREVM